MVILFPDEFRMNYMWHGVVSSSYLRTSDYLSWKQVCNRISALLYKKVRIFLSWHSLSRLLVMCIVFVWVLIQQYNCIFFSHVEHFSNLGGNFVFNYIFPTVCNRGLAHKYLWIDWRYLIIQTMQVANVFFFNFFHTIIIFAWLSVVTFYPFT